MRIQEPEYLARSGDSRLGRVRRRLGSKAFQQRDPPLLLPVTEAAAPQRLLRREAVFRRSLAVADLIAVGAALGLVILFSSLSLEWPALLAAPGVVLLAKVLGLYDRDHLLLNKRSLDEAPGLFQVAVLTTLLGWMLNGALFSRALTPPGGLALWGGMFGTLVVGRAVARSVARQLVPEERVLVVGPASAAARLRAKLDASPGVKATLVGWIPLAGSDGDRPSELVTVGNGEDLPERIAALKVDRVVVAPDEQTGDDVLNLIRMVKALGVRVSILPRLFEVVGSSVAFDDVDGLMLLGVRPVGLSRSSWFVKRAFDLTGAIAGLLVISPLLTVMAVAVKLDSRGPLLFGQRRVGRDGRTFCMWKFRTMHSDAEERKAELLALNEGAEGFFKIAHDPRVTRVGHWLRRTSLDELPQLLNVLRGEMSLVGPRPLVAEEDRRVDGWYRRRLHLTPGMTGHWQVLGSSRVPLSEMVVLDYLYLANWSLWNDVKILVRTMPRVVRARGL